jgi:hypothetical protein
MKLTGSKGERIAALVLGGFLLLVQLPRIPKLPLPFTAETLGYDAVWALITGAGVWLVLYGLGLVRKKAK